MAGYPCLFIGGVIDGEKRIVEPLTPVYYAATYDSIEGVIENHRYLLRSLCDYNGTDYYVYLHEKINRNDLIPILLEEYASKRQRKEK
jgi:hypothetical protein